MKKYNFAARAAVLALALTAAFAFNTSVHAQPVPGSLWYGGDFDGFNGLANELNTVVSDAHVFSDFTVGGGGWNVTALYSRNLMDFTTTMAAYEIRQGVSTNNGGVLIASGTLACTQVATGRNGFGFTEFTIMIAGLNVNLTPGNYHMNVAPIGQGSGRSFNSTTVGANGTGTPIANGNEFFRSTFFGFNYTPTDDPQLANGRDFSNGVVATVIPEPATWALLTCGVGALLAVRRRRSS